MTLEAIADTVLDESSSPRQLRLALDDFTQLCAGITGIQPDRSFDSRSGDTLLEQGVAINPGAAAHCVSDYRRSVVFIRGVYAAIRTAQCRFPAGPVSILYAGCGPFATLLLPLLCRFQPGELGIHLLDIHPDALDSVSLLITRFGFKEHGIQLVNADACSYQHHCALHLVIAETMQKALEQEPQLAVTANLAPQLTAGGIFVPQTICVDLYLARYQYELDMHRGGGQNDPDRSGRLGERHPLGTVIRLNQGQVAGLMETATYNRDSGKTELTLATVDSPQLEDRASFDLVLFTRIQVFSRYRLQDYESEITLPLKCHDLPALPGSQQLQVSYQLGSYPQICIRPATICASRTTA
jgi:hypothetical protein